MYQRGIEREFKMNSNRFLPFHELQSSDGSEPIATIWSDFESMRKFPKASDKVYSTSVIHYGTIDKKELPCLDCSMYDICRDEAIECRAFRKWVSTGDYDIVHRELKLRKCA